MNCHCALVEHQKILLFSVRLLPAAALIWETPLASILYKEQQLAYSKDAFFCSLILAYQGKRSKDLNHSILQPGSCEQLE
jgi:hypothetical protein